MKRRTSAFDFDFRLLYLAPRTVPLSANRPRRRPHLPSCSPSYTSTSSSTSNPKSPAIASWNTRPAYHRSRLTFYAGRKGCIWLGSTFKKSDKTRSNPRPTTGKLKTSVLRPVPRSFYCHFTSICHWSPYSTRQTQHRGRGGCAPPSHDPSKKSHDCLPPGPGRAQLPF